MNLGANALRATVAAVAIFGLAACGDSDNGNTEAENPVITQYGGTMEDPCGHLSGDTKKSCNKDVFKQRDASILRAEGFSGNLTMSYGRVCEDNGTVSGKWKGNASSVSYRGTVNGTSMNICINHSGKTSNPALGSGPSQ